MHAGLHQNTRTELLSRLLPGAEAGGGTGTEEISGRATTTKKEGKVVKKKKEDGKVTYVRTQKSNVGC